MEFLKELFGENALTYAQLEQAINAHNGNEANKNNQLRIGNLGTGEYVSKAKHDALQELFKGKETELTSANQLIEDLKKSTKGNEELQGKITGYETQVTQLQQELAETKLKSALKVALLAENALDVDYLTFKINESMKEQGKTLELDENENIKGWDGIISGVKTQFPTQFGAGPGTRKVIEGGKLPGGTHEPQTVTKEQFAKMGYNERLKLKQENEELFRQLTANN